MTPAIDSYSAPLAQPGQALESSRDSGYDLPASVGEVVDNSLQANATQIRIRSVDADDESAIVKMAFADNGDGIPPQELAHVLSLGYSSRYNSRTGMGRFGMGLKLASLGQSSAVEVYTLPKGESQIYCTSLDLQAVKDGDQTELRTRAVEAFPAEFDDLMTDPGAGGRFSSGTLVVWSDIDRLPNGDFERQGKTRRGKYQQNLQERREDLMRFLARAYRRFLHQGCRIELDGVAVDLYDPTFLLSSPRVIRQFGEDLRGEVIQETTIQIEGHPVHIVVTLSPRVTRYHRGKGGRPFEHLFIADDNARAISMLRADREIFYDIVPKMLPGAAKENDLDRFIGVQVSFPPALDEYFQVRNVKRGAEPVSKLRDEIRTFIQKPVKVARDKIRDEWGEAEQESHTSPADAGHEQAVGAVERAEHSTPAGRGNMTATAKDVDDTLREVAEDLGIDPNEPANQPKLDELKATFEERTLMVVDGKWPGKDMFDIRHLSGKAVLKLNHRHPFIAEVYDVVKQAAHSDVSALTPLEVKELLTKVDVALDVLFMAYAKAENMHADPEQAYADLRTYWGVFTAAYVNEGVVGS